MLSSNIPASDVINEKIKHLTQQINFSADQARNYIIQLEYLENYLDQLLADTYKEKQQIVDALDLIVTNLKYIFRNSYSETTKAEIIYHINFLGNKYESSSLYQRAPSCYEFSAAQNDPIGLFNSGRFHYHGLGGYSQNLAKAHELIKASNLCPAFASDLEKRKSISIGERIAAGVVGAILGPIIGAIGGFAVAVCVVLTASFWVTMLPSFGTSALWVFGMCVGGGALAGLIEGGRVGATYGWNGFTDYLSSMKKDNEYQDAMMCARRPQPNSRLQSSTSVVFSATNVNSLNDKTYHLSDPRDEKQAIPSGSAPVVLASYQRVPESKVAAKPGL